MSCCCLFDVVAACGLPVVPLPVVVERPAAAVCHVVDDAGVRGGGIACIDRQGAGRVVRGYIASRTDVRCFLRVSVRLHAHFLCVGLRGCLLQPHTFFAQPLCVVCAADGSDAAKLARQFQLKLRACKGLLSCTKQGGVLQGTSKGLLNRIAAAGQRSICPGSVASCVVLVAGLYLCLYAVCECGAKRLARSTGA